MHYGRSTRVGRNQHNRGIGRLLESHPESLCLVLSPKIYLAPRGHANNPRLRFNLTQTGSAGSRALDLRPEGQRFASCSMHAHALGRPDPVSGQDNVNFRKIEQPFSTFDSILYLLLMDDISITKSKYVISLF